jgi:hypothetical protein
MLFRPNSSVRPLAEPGDGKALALELQELATICSTEYRLAGIKFLHLVSHSAQDSHKIWTKQRGAGHWQSAIIEGRDSSLRQQTISKTMAPEAGLEPATLRLTAARLAVR